MRSFRENPDSAENQAASRQHEREVFALQMQATIRNYRIVQTEEANEEDPTDNP